MYSMTYIGLFYISNFFLFCSLKYLRTAVHFRTGQSSVSTVARDKDIGKSNRRLQSPAPPVIFRMGHFLG